MDNIEPYYSGNKPKVAELGPSSTPKSTRSLCAKTRLKSTPHTFIWPNKKMKVYHL